MHTYVHGLVCVYTGMEWIDEITAIPGRTFPTYVFYSIRPESVGEILHAFKATQA